jgi:translation initiation factor IF-2
MFNPNQPVQQFPTASPWSPQQPISGPLPITVNPPIPISLPNPVPPLQPSPQPPNYNPFAPGGQPNIPPPGYGGQPVQQPGPVFTPPTPVLQPPVPTGVIIPGSAANPFGYPNIPAFNPQKVAPQIGGFTFNPPGSVGAGTPGYGAGGGKSGPGGGTTINFGPEGFAGYSFGLGPTGFASGGKQGAGGKTSGIPAGGTGFQSGAFGGIGAPGPF